MVNSFNAIEERIIRTMFQEAMPMTVNEISKKAEISWITTKKYINILMKKGIVKEYKLETMEKPKVIFDFQLVDKIHAQQAQLSQSPVLAVA